MKNFNLSADGAYCKKCSNSCCMVGDSFYHPEDFNDVVNEVVSLLANRLARTTRFYYGLVVTPSLVRIGHGKYNDIYRCVYLMPFGCIIPAEKRPHVCRHYAPTWTNENGEVGGCEGLYSYKDYVKAWEPYIDEIVEKAQQQNIRCLT